MSRLFIFAACFAFLLDSELKNSVYARLPPSIQVCSRYDRNLADCIIRSVNLVRPALAQGTLGAGFGIPRIEPLQIDNINIGGTKDFNVVLSNLVIHKMSNFKIEKLRVNLNELKFDFILQLPVLDIKGKHDLVFRLFGFNVKGRGDVIAVFKNTRARFSLRARRYQKPDGKTYINFEKFIIKLHIGQRAIKLTNLFQGNPALEEIGNAFVNNNSDFFLSDVYPGIESSLSELFTTAANKIVSEASFDELFPAF